MSDASEAPLAVAGQVVEGPSARVRHERWWNLVLPDGRRAVLAQLLPELAADASLRRRWQLDVERAAGLGAPTLAETLAIGDGWRLRAIPAGESLDAWLRARSPAPIDEALDMLARVADALHALHAAGGVARDLEPRAVILGEDGRTWLCDVGLARLAILSSRTASSLMLDASPYVAPEALRRSVVDLRADLYTLGVLAWRALTGTLPFGDRLFRGAQSLPALASLRAGVPEPVAALVAACLAEDPERRPESARDVAAVLRGQRAPGTSLALAPLACQGCGAPVRAGLRLCLSCGKEAVQLRHVPAGSREGWALALLAAKEDADFMAKLRDFFAVSAETMPSLTFLIGDHRMYSKKERKRLQKIPACLFQELEPETARLLEARLKAAGFKVKTRSMRSARVRKALGIAAIVGGVIGTGLGIGMAAVTGGLVWVIPVVAFGGSVWGMTAVPDGRRFLSLPMAALRQAPAALPASDPLVARLAALLGPARSPDVRERVAELALLVQRLVDHRAQMAQGAAREIDALTGPLAPLIAGVEREVQALAALDSDLAGLDEGAMVRALAASEARKEPAVKREAILGGLDRLRELEERRAAGMRRLLEASSLLRRAVMLGLGRGDSEAESERELKLAMALLDEELGEVGPPP